MKKFLLIFIGCVFAVQYSGTAAVVIKKAAPVATQKTSGMDSASSLVPNVLNLISGVQQLTKTQRALTEECIPTSADITFVNDMVKEWAKTGASTADEAFNSLGVPQCATAKEYEDQIKLYGADADAGGICYDWFGDNSDTGMVWYKFPKATKAYYCTDGSIGSCSVKNRRDVSNIYEVFNLIDFDTTDYTADELTKASKLIAKIENCSSAKLNAKKKALWGQFLSTTISSVGQKTNSGNIMDVVSSVAGSTGSGAGGVLNSLTGVAGTLFGGQ